MPRVKILAAPRANLPGVWALGTSPKTGSVDPATGQPTVIPGKSGRFFANGTEEEIVISDDQLKELQSEPNRSLLAVVVIDQGEQPQPDQGGGAMAQNQPGTTVPPGTSPTPTPAPAPAPSPAPSPGPGTETPGSTVPAGTTAPKQTAKR